MSREDMRGLFAEFEQADAAIRRRDGGTGLGLAISMQLARAMGGEIHVVSAPGKGSTFTVDLPLARVAMPAAEEPERGVVVEVGRVLLAFDRPLERRALAYALTSAGVAAAEADFAAAEPVLELAARKGEPFDRLVVDGAQGAGPAGRLLAGARRLNPQQKVRGIVLVNVLARASLADFRAAGFDAYLVRPVRPASMMMQLGLRGPGRLDQHGGAPAAASQGAAPVRERAHRLVLLAEDNEINALLAKRVLEKCGCEYVAVPNGEEAVAAVRRAIDGEAPPLDLVLMDIFMPRLDGIEAARTIRRLYATASPGIRDREPPIVALTASAFAEDKRRYLEAGMDDYLAKPFDKAALEAVLKRWFGQQAPGPDADAAA
jgi:CheY-like chemotaxis protein